MRKKLDGLLLWKGRCEEKSYLKFQIESVGLTVIRACDKPIRAGVVSMSCDGICQARTLSFSFPVHLTRKLFFSFPICQTRKLFFGSHILSSGAGAVSYPLEKNIRYKESLNLCLIIFGNFKIYFHCNCVDNIENHHM